MLRIDLKFIVKYLKINKKSYVSYTAILSDQIFTCKNQKRNKK